MPSALAHACRRQTGTSARQLFFDLVFVFAITQLTALVEQHRSLLGVGKAGLVFAVMYWMYSGYAWLTNQVPPTTTARRLLLVCGMAAFLVSALAIPRAFDETAFAFSIGDALVVIVHSGLYAQAHRSSVWRFVPLNLIGAGCLVGAAFVSGAARYGFWIATLGLHYATSRLAAQVHESQASGYEVRAEHSSSGMGSFSSSHLAIAMVVGFTAHEWAVGRRRRESKRGARLN